MPLIKQTLRQFTFAVPDGTKKQLIRTFIRAVDGTDHPHDQEIEVATYKTIVRDYILKPNTERTVENTTEQWALSQEIEGTTALSCRDFVTLVEE